MSGNPYANKIYVTRSVWLRAVLQFCQHCKNLLTDADQFIQPGAQILQIGSINLTVFIGYFGVLVQIVATHLQKIRHPAQAVPGGSAYQAAPAQAPESQAACHGLCCSGILFVLWKVSMAKKAACFQSSAQSVHLAAEQRTFYRCELYDLCPKTFHLLCTRRRLYNNVRAFSWDRFLSQIFLRVYQILKSIPIYF